MKRFLFFFRIFIFSTATAVVLAVPMSQMLITASVLEHSHVSISAPKNGAPTNVVFTGRLSRIHRPKHYFVIAPLRLVYWPVAARHELLPSRAELALLPSFTDVLEHPPA